MNDDNILIADAKTYISIIHLLSSSTSIEVDDLSNVFNSLGSDMAVGKPHTYTNLHNILGLLLTYPTRSYISIDNIARFAQGVVNYARSPDGNSNTSEGLYEDLEEFANWISSRFEIDDSAIFSLDDSILLQTAYDLAADNRLQCEQFGYKVTTDGSINELLFQFIQAKTLYLSKYCTEIGDLSPLFEILEGYSPFDKWYRDIITPFTYYWNNYGSLNNNSLLDLFQFLKAESFNEKLHILIEPLNLPAYSEKLSVNNWISKVVMPLVVYHDYDFKPLLEWLYFRGEWNNQEPSKKYAIWNNAIRSIIYFKDYKNNVLDVSRYEDILKFFLGSCYYYAIFYETSEKVSSIEMLKIYDSIKDSLDIIQQRIGAANGGKFEYSMEKIDFGSLDKSSSLASFLNDSSNPFTELFNPSLSSVNFLQEAIITCEKLYPTSKFTILEFLKLKYSSTSDFTTGEREVAKIMTNLNSNNWSMILSSARLFTDSFISNDKTHNESINRLIIDRFLFNNLFDVVGGFYEEKELPITVDDFYSIILKKFWESFNKATNFNSKIGKLHEASQSIQLFDKISSDEQLSATCKDEIIRIKHLFKAVSNIKNFKIVIQKGSPFVPSDLISQFGAVSLMDGLDLDEQKRSPMALISTILEQNPKSYLAFEKLYKILNDLLIFFNDEHAEPTFYFNKLKSICIESALVDNNFQFAYRQSNELLDHYSTDQNKNLNEFWLTFYQVGKFISPEWFNESSSSQSDKIDILIKQRDILSKTLKFTEPSDTTIDNSRVILTQWESINSQIEDWYLNLHQDYYTKGSTSSNDAVPERMATLANDIMNDASNTTSQASEKLSNLFVSGLGWALGANPQ
ncbi:uncharacterized protein AC631_01485 [Debaryomyces fabryi]|uniref:Sec39 domain-containing protein n=1 Tax=Debaryomyces fabryi TaxID=58627 RepID=A0A0V1Q2Q5_9ASCO|nr:uncharacterized protein AC631_01485 [Debaryomyces fabryi]KSA02781.1 hypothetical protein AC631_01485 [Debaryomyces fabryi]CUM56145.1 unnamed protein product [Debaryomyces fabryi]